MVNRNYAWFFRNQSRGVTFYPLIYNSYIYRFVYKRHFFFLFFPSLSFPTHLCVLFLLLGSASLFILNLLSYNLFYYLCILSYIWPFFFLFLFWIDSPPNHICIDIFINTYLKDKHNNNGFWYVSYSIFECFMCFLVSFFFFFNKVSLILEIVWFLFSW